MKTTSSVRIGDAGSKEDQRKGAPLGDDGDEENQKIAAAFSEEDYEEFFVDYV